MPGMPSVESLKGTCQFYQLFSSDESFAIKVFRESGDVIMKLPVPVPSKGFSKMASLSGRFD